MFDLDDEWKIVMEEMFVAETFCGRSRSRWVGEVCALLNALLVLGCDATTSSNYVVY